MISQCPKIISEFHIYIHYRWPHTCDIQQQQVCVCVCVCVQALLYRFINKPSKAILLPACVCINVCMFCLWDADIFFLVFFSHDFAIFDYRTMQMQLIEYICPPTCWTYTNVKEVVNVLRWRLRKKLEMALKVVVVGPQIAVLIYLSGWWLLLFGVFDLFFVGVTSGEQRHWTQQFFDDQLGFKSVWKDII